MKPNNMVLGSEYIHKPTVATEWENHKGNSVEKYVPRTAF